LSGCYCCDNVEEDIVLSSLESTVKVYSRYGYGSIQSLNVKATYKSALFFLLKRLFDIIASVFLLMVLSPIIILAAVLIKLDSKGPVLFMQDRVGKDGNVFKMYKFRSMYIDAEERLKELRYLNEAKGPIFKIKNDPRVTRIGKFLRKSSIDELLQLINVIKGEMSLVGPRPPLPREVKKYTLKQKLRLAITPGITGLWQVSGRSKLTFDDMVNLDLYYIENKNILLDLKILIKTIPAVLKMEGAY